MGAGRKTHTVLLNTSASAPQPQPSTSRHITARNLPKSNLGGVIFGCTHRTMQECLTNQLFGLPGGHFHYVQKIGQGLPLFLFNYSNRRLHGIFEAASSGRMNINPYAWTAGGTERTLFPAQVQIRVMLLCQPLVEDQFKPIIADNYYGPSHFWFELDHTQASMLISLLQSAAPLPRSFVHAIKPKGEHEGQMNMKMGNEPAKFSSWASDCSDADHDIEGNDADELYNQLEFGELDSTDGVSLDGQTQLPEAQVDGNADRTNQPSEAQVDGNVYGKRQQSEAQVDGNAAVENEVCCITEKLQILAAPHENKDSSLTNYVGKPDDIDETYLEDGMPISEQFGITKENKYCCTSSHCQSIITELIRDINELKTFKTEQTMKMSSLEQKLVQAQNEIHLLKDHCKVVETPVQAQNEIHHLKDNCKVLETPLISATLQVDSKFDYPTDMLSQDPMESIYLVGGNNGGAWLSALDLYFPSCDEVKSLTPMNSIRAHTAIAQLNDKLYVVGGGDTNKVWYNTVEAYNPVDDEWTFYPSLNDEKGSLAAISMDDKLFVLGGGNGTNCFSDVEMFDFDIGKWIKIRSMLQKRFAVASIQHNGAIYATGGFDGKEYLNSVERLDLREHSWRKIANMNSYRSCHTMAVLNEKIYVLGGFDGKQMVSNVEVYDPRQGGVWMTSEPMKQYRGYLAAAVVKNSIYILGGVGRGDKVLDTVECYKEGQGWTETVSTAIGRRCHILAVPLQS